MHPYPYPEDPDNFPSPGALPPMEPLQPLRPPMPTVRQPGEYPPMELLPLRAPYPSEQVFIPAESSSVQESDEDQEEKHTTAYSVAKLTAYLSWFFVVIEILLCLRFFLKLVGAVPTNPFAAFLYALTSIFLFVFEGIVKDPTFGANSTHVLEWSTLIAILVYALFFWTLRMLLHTIFSPSEKPVE